jgi:hypothetical protein
LAAVNFVIPVGRSSTQIRIMLRAKSLNPNHFQFLKKPMVLDQRNKRNRKGTLTLMRKKHLQPTLPKSKKSVRKLRLYQTTHLFCIRIQTILIIQ